MEINSNIAQQDSFINKKTILPLAAIIVASLSDFYGVCIFLGFTAGYRALFVTIAAEQFGTNIRATVTTTATNFVRGTVVPVSLLLQYLKGILNGSIINAAIIVAIICLVLAFWALSNMEETFSKDLDYTED